MSHATKLKLLWLGARYGGVVSKRLGGFFTWRLWFTPWEVQLSERARQREAEWLVGTKPLAVPSTTGVLSGFVAGEGPTILLVHGWGDQASRMGAFVRPLVEAGFRVVGIDLPAHGDSPGRMTNAYEWSAAIRATVDHVGGVAAVVAHSIGGVNTLLAMRNGMRVGRLVLLASALRMQHGVGQFAALFQLPQRSIDGLVEMIEHRYGPFVWDDLSSDRHAAALDVPALLFHDRQDTQVDFADGLRLHEAWPSSRLVATEGLGHDRILRDPEVVAQAVAFLSEAIAPAPSAEDYTSLEAAGEPWG